MNFFPLPRNNKDANKVVLRWVFVFFTVTFILQCWRIFSLNASYDQGLFLQEIWNTSNGRAFESTLASVLSAPVKFQGEIPKLGYIHLSQHFTPLLSIWSLLVKQLGVWLLPIVQTLTLTLGGWVLFQLGKVHLPNKLAGWIACSYFTTGCVIGPSLENFHDLCIVPLLVFTLLLGISKHQIILYLIAAVLLPLVREDVGILSFGIGLWMILRKPSWRLWGLGLCIYSLTSVLVITNLIMPIFGNELQERFMQERFSQYLQEDSGGTIDVLIAMVKQPLLLIKELLHPPGKTLNLLITIFLPLAFVPLISVDSWLLILLPLFVALSSQGGNALSVHLRFILYLVPGVFGGSVFWWKNKLWIFEKIKFKSIWEACMSIALFFALIGNPHRSLSAIIPDSVDPWIHIPIHKQFKRGLIARQIISSIPKEASVAAETHLIPQLATRRVLVRFPETVKYKDLQNKIAYPEYIISQPSYNNDYASAFKHHAIWVIKSGNRMKELVNSGKYGVLRCDKNTLILQYDYEGSSELKRCLVKEINKNQNKIFNLYGVAF